MNCEEGHLGGYIMSNPDSPRPDSTYPQGDPQTWTPLLWQWAFDTLGLRSVLDIGCGEGHSAKFFRSLGCEIQGVDGSQQAKRDSVIPGLHVIHDFVDGPYLPHTTFDLIWCCEFMEHVEEHYSDNFLATFRWSHRYLMVTYATPGQPGWHHVNCQPASYWVQRMKAIGFQLDPLLTYVSRNIAEPGHFQRKGLVFVREGSPTHHKISTLAGL